MVKSIVAFTPWEPRVTFDYTIFVSDDNNFKCENVPNLWVYLKGYSKDKNCSSNYGCYAYTETKYYTKLSLSSSESSVYVENYGKEQIESGEWDLVCHYGPYYLLYNDTNFETNAPTAYSKWTHATFKVLVGENYDSCPTSYCYSIREIDNVDVTYSFFSNDKKYIGNNACYVSDQFGSSFSCGAIQKMFDTYKELKNKRTEKGTIEDISNLKNHVKKFQSFCASVFKGLNYGDQNRCVKECLEIKDILYEELDGVEGQCNVSHKLIVFIRNILRWAKYILLVIVIVLGILDFMKAMGADKEDEMKKAQQRFIKRLIAAALLFIVPLILEFVLDKMGFGYDDCGLF